MILAIGILSVDWSVVAVDFGQRLKELRVQAGMTQLQLAQRMGVTKSVVSFYELQERTPSPDILVKLSGIFKVSTDYLLGLDPRETIDISGLSREDIAIMRALAESLRRKSLYNHGE
ncbi:MAG: helix-turn-helix transcriptional regulator [Oscillibacter sp.]|jgi:hypothetical protein|nr:helix-turn-helix transcriptional regulator [Oscillibacter sp.]HAZ68254.1 XRE family transcriptional regulator [Oscillibacter sp.]